MKKEIQKPAEQKPEVRAGNFDEVTALYSEAQALAEAARCLQCKDPACVRGCPVGIDIKEFIRRIAAGDYAGAYQAVKEKNNFPSLCGRVCPAEYQCRKACVLTHSTALKKGSGFADEAAINIHFLERFAGDWGMKHFFSAGAEKSIPGVKAAVVGSGPAGLCCAGELARAGIKVTIFEALHKTGGVLRYGIPPFRLPRDILDFEIDHLKKMGVEFRLNYIIGKTLGLKELIEQGYKAIFLGLGAGTPSFLRIPGENFCNVYSANEFLTRVNLMSAYRFPEYHTPVTVGEHIVVIGGGNTAMDSARAALRLQKINGIKPDVSIFYRRTLAEMPARRLEIEHAEEEGVKFRLLTAPKEFIGDSGGRVRKLRSLECSLGEPDASGRRSPVIIEGSDFEVDCDTSIIAIGLGANRVLTAATPELTVDKYGDVRVDPQTMETSIKGVFAGGDIVGGEGTVIEAMGMAKKAASSIIKHLGLPA